MINPTVVIHCRQGDKIEVTLDGDRFINRGHLTIYSEKNKPIVRVDFSPTDFFEKVDELENFFWNAGKGDESDG